MAIAICNVQTSQSGREMIDYGTPLFPIACYQDELQNMDVPWHWHDELEAAIVTKGSAVVAFDNEKRCLSRGEGFFINAGVLHAAWYEGGGECQFHSMVFHPRLLSSGVDGVYWQKYLQPLIFNNALKGAWLAPNVPWQKACMSAVGRAWQACTAEAAGHELWVRNELSQLIFGMITHGGEASVKPAPKAARDNERIKTMLKMISERCGEPLTVGQIAQSAAISESECLRCFRATIGLSPIQYLKTLRLQKAVELLERTDMTVAAIGERCGFQDMSYFSKSFRELKGCTPSAYRGHRPSRDT